MVLAPGSHTTEASASAAASVGYAAVGAALCLNMLTSMEALHPQPRSDHWHMSGLWKEPWGCATLHCYRVPCRHLRLPEVHVSLWSADVKDSSEL